MKNKNSVGVDEIPRLLKFCKYTLADIIANLINKALGFGQFPNILKSGKLMPLHKKDVRNLLKNCQPILSYISKLS